MRILTRYLLRVHIAPFLFSLTVLTGLLFINTVARRFDALAGKGLAAGVIFEALALSLPHIVALTLPMAVLVAVLYAFSQLAAENEISALKANGVNLTRALRPMLVAGVVVAIGMVWFNDQVLPEMNHRLKNLMADINRKSPTLTLKEQTINAIRPRDDLRAQYYLQAAHIDPVTNRLADVAIYDMSLGQKVRTIYADSGRMAWNAARTNLLLTLYDGYVLEVDTYDPRQFQYVEFRQQEQVLKGLGDELTRVNEDYRSDREMSLAMLKERIDSARVRRDSLWVEAGKRSVKAVTAALAGPTAEPDTTLRLPLLPGGTRYLDVLPPGAGSAYNAEDTLIRHAKLELEVLRNQAEAAQDEMNRYTVEYHKKYAIPFACIVFVLVGAPIAVRFPRGGAGMVIAISLTVFSIYYMSLIGGESLGDRGIIRPWVGPWAPNLIFGMLGVWGMARIGRETATTRGGGWEDLWASLRGVLTRPFRRHVPLRTGESSAMAGS